MDQAEENVTNNFSADVEVLRKPPPDFDNLPDNGLVITIISVDFHCEGATARVITSDNLCTLPPQAGTSSSAAISNGTLHIYGVTAAGNSIMANVENFGTSNAMYNNFAQNFKRFHQVRIPKKAMALRAESDFTSFCQVEMDCDYSKIVPQVATETMAPLRLLSIDVLNELASLGVGPIVQISCVLQKDGDSASHVRKIFCRKPTTAESSNVEIVLRETEPEMLHEFSKFVREVDPDIVTAFSIRRFHLPNFINRCCDLQQELQDERSLALLSEARFIGRLRNVSVESPKSARAKKDSKTSGKILGRVILDAYDLTKKLYPNLEADPEPHPVLVDGHRPDYSDQNYTFKNVCRSLLSLQIECYSPVDVTFMFDGSDAERCKLAEYGLSNAMLQLQLLTTKLKTANETVAGARAANITPLCWLINSQNGMKNLTALQIQRLVNRVKNTKVMEIVV